MYFRDICDSEVIEFHHKIKVNFKINLSGVLVNDLFSVEPVGDLLKICPLFYCDEIKSSNQTDEIISSNCIVCENKPTTSLYFISEENSPVHSLNYLYRSDNLNYWVFYLYDEVSGNSINGVSAYTVLEYENEVIKEFELFSDEKGLVYIDTSNFNYDKLSINFKIMDSSLNFNYEVNNE